MIEFLLPVLIAALLGAGFAAVHLLHSAQRGDGDAESPGHGHGHGCHGCGACGKGKEEEDGRGETR